MYKILNVAKDSGNQLGQAIVGRAALDRQKLHLALRNHEKGHGIDINAYARASDKRKLLPTFQRGWRGSGLCGRPLFGIIASAGNKAQTHLGNGDDHGSVGHDHTVTDDGVYIDHILQVLQGGLHDLFNRVLHHCYDLHAFITLTIICAKVV